MKHLLSPVAPVEQTSGGTNNASPRMTLEPQKPPLVLHLIYRLAAGGLENGLVHLINRMPAERYRHAIVCLSDFNHFSGRIERPGIPLIALRKGKGALDLPLYQRL